MGKSYAKLFIRSNQLDVVLRDPPEHLRPPLLPPAFGHRCWFWPAPLTGPPRRSSYPELLFSRSPLGRLPPLRPGQVLLQDGLGLLLPLQLRLPPHPPLPLVLLPERLLPPPLPPLNLLRVDRRPLPLEAKIVSPVDLFLADPPPVPLISPPPPCN